MMLQPHLGQLPPGISIAGSCDPKTGAPSGSQTGYYYLETPSGNQCLTDAAISSLYPPNLAPATAPPAGYIPNQAGPGSTSPAAQAAQSAINTALAQQNTVAEAAVSTGSNPLTSAGIVATDGSSILTMFETDYGPLPLWGWIAVAAGAALLLTRK